MAFAKIIILTLFMTFFTFSSVMSQFLSSRYPYDADKIVGNWYVVAVICPIVVNFPCSIWSITAAGNNHFTLQYLTKPNKTVATIDFNNNVFTFHITESPSLHIPFQVLDYKDEYQIVLEDKKIPVIIILGRLPGVTEELFEKYENVAITNNMVYNGVHFKNCPTKWKPKLWKRN